MKTRFASRYQACIRRESRVDLAFNLVCSPTLSLCAPGRQPLPAVNNPRLRIQSFTVTAFSSVNDSTPSCPNSRPQPDSLKPPNGRLGSKTLKQLTQTAPAFSTCAKRNAFETSRVQMLAAKP